MLPRRTTKHDNDYNMQKRVATELSRLAKMEKVLVFSAIQTNREGNENLDSPKEDKVIGLNKVAESYGKLMPVDYLVTINQTMNMYDDGDEKEKYSKLVADMNMEKAITNAKCNFYIAKNRNGPKFQSCQASINYETMKMKDVT